MIMKVIGIILKMRNGKKNSRWNSRYLLHSNPTNYKFFSLTYCERKCHLVFRWNSFVWMKNFNRINFTMFLPENIYLFFLLSIRVFFNFGSTHTSIAHRQKKNISTFFLFKFRFVRSNETLVSRNKRKIVCSKFFVARKRDTVGMV